MAKLINQSQAIRAGVTSPKAVYQRIIAARADGIGLGVKHVAHTEFVAQDVWLYKARVFVSHRTDAAEYSLEVRVKTGTTHPKDYNEALDWEDLMPVKWATKDAAWLIVRKTMDIEWNLCLHYTGKRRMFAVTIRNWKDTNAYLMADFLISEG